MCGGLWKADRFPSPRIESEAEKESDIYIVIYHCENDLDWVSDFIEGNEGRIVSMHIITKCGHRVNGAPDGAIIEEMPNVGRNHHSYSYYITTLLDEKMKKYGKNSEDSIVMFLKDDK